MDVLLWRMHGIVGLDVVLAAMTTYLPTCAEDDHPGGLTPVTQWRCGGRAAADGAGCAWSPPSSSAVVDVDDVRLLPREAAGLL